MTGGGSADRPLLRHPEREAAFSGDGYVVLPFLDGEETATLREASLGLHGDSEDGLVIDYTSTDRSAMEAAARLASGIWERHVPEHFVDMRPVFTSFVVKHSGRESSMFLHDDRTYVDERHHRAATVWIPLVDVGPGLDNGGLAVVPRSTELAVGPSGTRTPEPFRLYERHLVDRLVPLAVDAGSAVVYGNRLLHGSASNDSDLPRPAIVCVLIPREAELIHVVGAGRRRRAVHRVDEQFFLRHHPHDLERGMPSEYPVVEVVEAEVHLDPERVASVLRTDVAPPVEPLVPADLRGSVTAVVPGAGEQVTRIRRTEQDLEPSAAEVGALEPSADVVEARGCGSVHGPDLEGWLEGLGVVRSDPRPDDRAVLVDPGGRLVLRTSPPGELELDVVESTPTRAGVISDGAARVLERDHRVLAVGEEHVLWNDGPGPLLVVLGSP